MTGRDDELPKGREGGESPSERRAWVIGYVVIFIVLAAGAARRLWALF